MKLKKVVALVAVGAVATNLVACSSSSGGSATTAAAETTAAAAETKAAETTAAAAKDGEAKGIKVGFTNSYNGNSYRQTEEKQMQIVADKLKADGYISEYTVAEANQDTATQIAQIEDFITQGYDIIIVDPASTSSLNNAIMEACDAGIPVINVDSGVNESHCVTTVYSDNKQNGRACGLSYAEFMGDKEIYSIMLSGEKGNVAGNERRQGLICGILEQRLGISEEEAWKMTEEADATLLSTGSYTNEEAKFTIAGQGWGNWTIAEGLVAAEDLITANPDVNLVMGENDPMLIGALTALDNAGITYGTDGTVKLISAADGSKTGYDYIKEGKIMAIGENSPAKIAELGMKIAQEILVDGADPESYDDITMTQAAAVTVDNVDEHYEYGF